MSDFTWAAEYYSQLQGQVAEYDELHPMTPIVLSRSTEACFAGLDYVNQHRGTMAPMSDLAVRHQIVKGIGFFVQAMTSGMVDADKHRIVGEVRTILKTWKSSR